MSFKNKNYDELGVLAFVDGRTPDRTPFDWSAKAGIADVVVCE
jgi:hypothetical protein